jgi:hypothetical protein
VPPLGDARGGTSVTCSHGFPYLLHYVGTISYIFYGSVCSCVMLYHPPLFTLLHEGSRCFSTTVPLIVSRIHPSTRDLVTVPCKNIYSQASTAASSS